MVTLQDKDQVRVAWPNGHGYDVYKLDNGVAPPNFIRVGSYEIQADGTEAEIKDQAKADQLARMLELVAGELRQVATALRNEGMRFDWRPQWSTYTLEAQSAVYELMKSDGVLP